MFDPKIPRACLYLFFAASTLFPLSLAGRTISWSSEVNDTFIQSDGSSLDNSFTFQLGSFDSITPDASNVALWGNDWKPFDQSFFNVALTFYSSSANHQGDGTSDSTKIPVLTPPDTFAFGEEAFVWVYNDQNVTTTTEWALYNAADWTFPVPSNDPGLPLEWGLSEAHNPVWGGVNDVTGTGGFRTSSDSIFDIQTHRVLQPVPEPGVLIFLTLALGFLGGQRRR